MATPITYVNFHFPDGVEDQMEYGEFQIVIGMGYIAENGARYRVVDYWLVDEKHSGGLNPHGIHIFLEHIAESDDRPKKLYPSYY